MDIKTRFLIAFCFVLVIVSSLFLFDVKLYCVKHDINGTLENVCFDNSEDYIEYKSEIIKKINKNQNSIPGSSSFDPTLLSTS